MEMDASSSDEEIVPADDSDYNLRMFGISRALPVPEGAPNFEGPPQTAEDYLQWVRYEAMRCPQVVRAEISPDKLASTGGPPDAPLSRVGQTQAWPVCPEWAQPSNSWVQQFLVDFKQLRLHLVELALEHEEVLSQVKLPSSRDLQAWDRICFGPGGDSASDQPQPPSVGSSQGVTAYVSDQPQPLSGGSSQEAIADAREDLQGLGIDRISAPLLKTVLALDQVRVVALLTWLVEEFEDLSVLSYSRSQWLFALSATIEKPIHCGTGASYRSLLRKCCALRSATQHRQDPQLPGLNTLIAVAGGYFGQDEVLAKLVAHEELP